MVRDDTLGEISEVTATRREHERLGEKKLKLPIITSTSVRIANCVAVWSTAPLVQKQFVTETPCDVSRSC